MGGSSASNEARERGRSDFHQHSRTIIGESENLLHVGLVHVEDDKSLFPNILPLTLAADVVEEASLETPRLNLRGQNLHLRLVVCTLVAYEWLNMQTKFDRTGGSSLIPNGPSKARTGSATQRRVAVLGILDKGLILHECMRRAF